MPRYWFVYLMLVPLFVVAILLLDGMAQTVVFLALVAAMMLAFEVLDRRQGGDSGREPDRWEWLAMAVVGLAVLLAIPSHDTELIVVIVLVPLAGWAARITRQRLVATQH